MLWCHGNIPQHILPFPGTCQLLWLPTFQSCACQLVSALPAKSSACQVHCGLPVASGPPDLTCMPTAELHVEAGMRDVTDAFKFWSWALKQLPGEDPTFNCTR